MANDLPMKHQVGKLIFVTAIGAIVTKVLETAYEKKFTPEPEDNED